MAESAAGLERTGAGAGTDRGADHQSGSLPPDDITVPVRAIQEYLETLHGLQLSVGEIQALTHRARRQLQPQAEALRAAIQTSTVVHGDETGWREDGETGYVWAFVTSRPMAVRYFEHNRSRGHAVPKRILGPRFRGWLVSDFYSAYNLILGHHQRCWVHLLRDLHALKEEHEEDTAVVQQWATAVRQVCDDALDWLDAHPQAMAKERKAAYTQAFTRICALGQQYARMREQPMPYTRQASPAPSG